MSIKEVTFNKKAKFLYELKEKFEAGIVLWGSEVKSLRAGRCHLKDAYVAFVGDEAFLQKAHISPHAASLEGGHQPERLRKLLLHKNEIEKIRGLVQQKKMACIPLRIYFKKGKAKVEIVLGIGKSQRDKRATLRKKTDERQIERSMKKTKLKN